MELKRIIKSTSFLVVSKVIQFFIGIIRSKIAAVTIGTTGVGIFSQVNYLVQMISNTTLLSMNDGLVKQIAQNKGEMGFRETLKGLMKSYSILIFISSLFAIIICIAFARPLTIFFLGDLQYLNFYLIGISCLPITMSNSLSFALLKSYKATKSISRSNIVSSIITVIAFLPLVYIYKVKGAVISVVVNYTVLLVINNYQARKQVLNFIGIKFKQLFTAKTNRKYTKELLHFAFYGATSGFILIISESICRSIVINELGIDKMGIYSPITSWGGLFQGFILSSLSIYLYPRVSEAKTNKEISGVVNDFYRLITFILIPFIFIAIPLRKIIIPLFYSHEFIEASLYLPWHFIGLVFYSWFYVLTQIMTPIGKIKLHGMLIIVMSIMNILIVYFLTDKIGLYAWMLKFLISPIAFFIIYIYFLTKFISFKIEKANILLMVYIITMSLFLLLIDDLNIKYFILLIAIILLWTFLRPNEKTFIQSKLNIFNIKK